MTTAYTPILQLALPVVGELDGTWGTVVNDNITSMIEQAITGLATINTWTTASHTLTTANGTTDEARCAVLECSGAPGAAATVICPTATKLYVIKNSVTGGYAVTLKTSAGTGVSVPNGSTALLYCDGTNVVSGATYMATLSTNQVDILAQGDLRLQDTTGGEYVAIQAPTTLASSYTLTLPVDDGSLGQALITDGNGVLSWSTFVVGDVVGPASATDSAVPTFNGTTGKLIKNNSGVTIASGVVTASGFGGPLNGAVGGATPAAGAFTTLSTTSTITVNGNPGSTGQPLISGGSSASPTWGSPFLIDATDIGYAPNQIPLNQYLGRLAYQDALGAGDDVANVFVGVSDVGYQANQVPLNQYLGSMAFQNEESVTVASLTIASPISTPAVAPTIASATTIAPTTYITFISGTAAIVNITAPTSLAATGGVLILIPTGIFTTTTAGNIALASTATVGRAMTMVYDFGTTKWYPSY